jgi:CBS domain-containing protein
MRARDIMTSQVHTIWQNSSVESAAQLMTAKAVTALPVVDMHGTLVGIVSESDLLWHRVPAEPADAYDIPETGPEHRPGMVVEVMSAYPLTTTPEIDVARVAEAMLEHDVRSVPVLEGRTLVGIISRRDILRTMVRGDRELAYDVQQRLDEYAGENRRWTAAVEGGVAAVTGDYRSDTERAVVAVLTRTVPGVSAVKVATSSTG